MLTISAMKSRERVETKNVNTSSPLLLYSSACSCSPSIGPVCAYNGWRYRHYIGNRHYIFFRVCAKQAHRHYSGQPAIHNRHYRGTTTTRIGSLRRNKHKGWFTGCISSWGMRASHFNPKQTSTPDSPTRHFSFMYMSASASQRSRFLTESSSSLSHRHTGGQDAPRFL